MDKKLPKKTISQAIIRRLPRYYRYLAELKASDVERISSSDLAKMMGVTASQIRQDLNNFGGFGQQGYGYNVQKLHDEISRILGIDRVHNIVVIGAGNFGRALAGYSYFARSGFCIRGLFDRNPELIGKTFGGIQVYPMEELESFIKKNNIEIAALTVPQEAAREIGEQVCAYGIKGIWNFAHTDLQVPKNVVVENVHLSESIMRLSYNLVNRRKRRAAKTSSAS